MVITDDGRGGAVLDGSSIQDRVAAFGGTLEVRSSPGEGSTIRAAIPLS